MSDVKWVIIHYKLCLSNFTSSMKEMNGAITTRKLMSGTFQMATRSPVRYYFSGKHQTVLWMKALANCLCDRSMTNKDFSPWGLCVASSFPRS